MLKQQDKQEILTLLESLTDIARHGDCSDRFFRQVYTAKVMAIQGSGIMEKIAADIAESEAKAAKAAKHQKNDKEDEET